jgi:DNA-binding transcriptional ArsR family regulator
MNMKAGVKALYWKGLEELEFNMSFRDEEEKAALSERLSMLDGFSRIVFRYGRLLSVTGGVSLKTAVASKSKTAVDMVMEYLESVGAVDFESGKGSAQIAKNTGLAKITVQKALQNLVERRLVKVERQGRNVRYYLAKKA